MGRERCPNCKDGGLVILREEHQLAGERSLWLRWMICSRCHHVALDGWSFVDTVNETTTQSEASEPTDNGAESLQTP